METGLRKGSECKMTFLRQEKKIDVQFKDHTNDPWGMEIEFLSKQWKVVHLYPGFQAQRIGVKAGDVIFSMNDQMLDYKVREAIEKKLSQGRACKISFKPQDNNEKTDGKLDVEVKDNNEKTDGKLDAGVKEEQILTVGTVIQLRRLRAGAKYNGKLAEICQPYDAGRNRYCIKVIENGDMLAVHPANIIPSKKDEDFKVSLDDNALNPWGLQIDFEACKWKAIVDEGKLAEKKGVKTGDTLLSLGDNMLDYVIRNIIWEQLEKGEACELCFLLKDEARKVTFKTNKSDPWGLEVAYHKNKWTVIVHPKKASRTVGCANR